MTNYNDITIAELDVSSFSEIDRKADFVFSYSEIEPEPVENGTRIYAETDKNTFLQLAEMALDGSEYLNSNDTLYASEQITIDCGLDRDYVASFELAMYFGNSPDEVKENLANNVGNGVPLTFEERDRVFEFAVDYAENVLNKDFDELIAETEQEQENEYDLEM